MQRQAIKTKPLTRDEAMCLLRAHEAEIRAQGVTRLAVFGSTARDEARADSDLDLLVDIDWRRKFSLFDWAGLELRLRDLLGREVEVTLRRNLKPFVKGGILAEAVEVFPQFGRRSDEDGGNDMPAHKARQSLQDILDAIAEIETFVAGKSYDDYLGSALLRRGVERDIEIISEASRRIPADLIAQHPQIGEIGNILRHAYRAVDSSIIWSLVNVELARHRQAVKGIVTEIDNRSQAPHSRSVRGDYAVNR
ncbi:MAG: HepT-like ribonuclease domain-containing protein [Dongiaceae bacterium]